VTVVRTGTRAIGFLVPLLVWTAACATGVRPQRPDRGVVTVGVTAKGTAVSTMRFTVTIEPAGIRQAVNADAGVLTRSDVPFGDHVVRLLDVPAQCRIDGAAERTITISREHLSAVLRFHVVCG
jgi:hypothetical protein